MNSTKSIGSKLILFLAALALIAGCKKEKEPEVKPAPAVPAQGIVSAEKTSFDEVTSKLDRGGNLYAYVSTEQFLGGLSDKLAGVSNLIGNLPIPGVQSETLGRTLDFVNSWLKDSGVEQISGIGMSSIAREPSFYYSKLIVHHYPGHSDGVIWSVFGREPHPLKELDLLPATTALASFSDLDLPLVWKDIQKRVDQLNVSTVSEGMNHWPDQFKGLTGLDWDKVLASLGGNYGIVLTLDPDKKITLPLPTPLEIPSPGLAIIIKVKSDVIFDRVDELCKSYPLVTRTDTVELKMRSLTIPLPLPVELRPSIARSGDYLIIATSDSLIQEMLDVKAGKKKGFKSTPEFARLSQGIPLDGNNVFLVGDQFIKTMMQAQHDALTNQSKLSQSQIDAFSKSFGKATNNGNLTVGRNGESGWEGYANGSQSMQSMIVPVAAGAGLVAAVAIPNIIRARSTSKENACVNNMRLIDAAKQQWALENKKQNSDTPAEDDLLPYLGKGAKPSFPVCPGGGTYKIGTVGEKPSCSIHGELP